MITGIFPPDIGGPATYVPQVAAGLIERGHLVTVLTLSDRLEHDNGAHPFRVVRLARRVPFLLRQLKTFFAILRLGQTADLLFVNGLALEAALANLVLRKPLVMKVVGDLAWERATNRDWTEDPFEVFQQKRYGLRTELLKKLRTWWTRQGHAIIVPSHYLAGRVGAWGVPEGKIRVIYNALQPLGDVRRATLPLKTRFNAVTVGRLVSLKRIDQILAAVAQVDRLGVVIVGDGPERARLERLAADRGLNDRVYFAGQRDRSETLALMAACDFLVLNSTYEGMPHVALEAMALGLPVVATAVGGTPEVVRDGRNGLLIPSSDEEALGRAMARLYSDRELYRRLAAGAGQRAVSFGFQSMLEATEKLLLERRG